MSSRLTYSIVFLCVLGGALIAMPGCKAGSTSNASGEASGVGDPCVPQQENDPTFLGFEDREVNIETASPSCLTAVCLVNHFRGRASCPYGQSADGTAPNGATACKTPKGAAVTGDPNDARRKAQVAPQCVDRSADKSVYCSCRCANTNGRTDDGASYCACPDGFSCTNVVSSIGASTNDLAGSYCVKQGTVWDKDTACNQGDCDPVAKKCN